MHFLENKYKEIRIGLHVHGLVPGAVEVWCQGSCCGSSVVFVVLVMFLVLVLVCPHRKQIILTINSAALLSLPTTPPCAFDNTTNYIPLQDISHIKYVLPIISSEYLLEYNVFEISMLNVVIGNILGRSSIANCVHKLD